MSKTPNEEHRRVEDAKKHGVHHVDPRVGGGMTGEKPSRVQFHPEEVESVLTIPNRKEVKKMGERNRMYLKITKQPPKSPPQGEEVVELPTPTRSVLKKESKYDKSSKKPPPELPHHDLKGHHTPLQHPSHPSKRPSLPPNPNKRPSLPPQPSQQRKISHTPVPQPGGGVPSRVSPGQPRSSVPNRVVVQNKGSQPKPMVNTRPQGQQPPSSAPIKKALPQNPSQNPSSHPQTTPKSPVGSHHISSKKNTGQELEEKSPSSLGFTPAKNPAEKVKKKSLFSWGKSEGEGEEEEKSSSSLSHHHHQEEDVKKVNRRGSHHSN